MENNAEMHGSRYDAMVKQLEAQRAEKMKSAPAEDSPEAKEVIAADIQKFDPTGEELHKLGAGDNVPQKETPKEEKEKAQFNPMRLFKKVGGGMFTAFWIAILLAFAVLGGSLAANEAVIRPTGYKILYFFYGIDSADNMLSSTVVKLTVKLTQKHTEF